MMRLARSICIGWVLALAAAAPALAIENCFDCVLGLYDDVNRTSVMGTATVGAFKSVYLGIDYALPESGLIALEFSIAGMRNDVDGIIVTSVEWAVQPAVLIGSSIVAPADTSRTSTGTGGQTVGWSKCLPGSRTLARIEFLHFTPLVNKVFQVKRKYPPSNTLVHSPALFRCDSPDFTTVRITGGCYTLNWNGDPSALVCVDKPIAVEQRAWTGIKGMFR